MARFEISNVIHKPDVRGTISLIGRAMITLGLILLLFVAYQLWGTNLIEQRNQKALKSEFKDKLAKLKNDPNTGSPTTTDPDSPSTSIPGDDPTIVPDEAELAILRQDVVRGEPIAQMQIPKIGLDSVVISGTDRTSLTKGPGHYPATPLPGQFGNSAIAGHRTTYGSPFARLNELGIGDKIVFQTVRGTFTYEVNEANKIVTPEDVSVIAPTIDPSDPTGQTLLPTLTLTTCHPKYSAAQRLIIKAKLVSEDTDRATVAAQLFDQDGKIPLKIDIGNDETANQVDGIGHSNILVAMALASLQLPLLWWLLLFVAVGSIWWYFFKRFRNWKVWMAGSAPFLVAMLLYFIQLERVLPSNI